MEVSEKAERIVFDHYRSLVIEIIQRLSGLLESPALTMPKRRRFEALLMQFKALQTAKAYGATEMPLIERTYVDLAKD